MRGGPRFAAIACLLAGLAVQPAAVRDAAAGTPAPAKLDSLFGGPFSLTDHDGRARTERSYPGRYLLLTFGYTYCPDICPTGLATMAAALDLLGPAAARVQPLFITVDPARDTVEQLRGYVTAFHPRLVGLTGSEAEIAAAAKACRVHRSKVQQAGEAAADYLVNHSSLTYLMDPAGRFLTLFPHGSDMADAMRRHMSRAASPSSRRDGVRTGTAAAR